MKFDKLKRIFAGFALSACVGTTFSGSNVGAIHTTEEFENAKAEITRNLDNKTAESACNFVDAIWRIINHFLNEKNVSLEVLERSLTHMRADMCMYAFFNPAESRSINRQLEQILNPIEKALSSNSGIDYAKYLLERGFNDGFTSDDADKYVTAAIDGVTKFVEV